MAHPKVVARIRRQLIQSGAHRVAQDQPDPATQIATHRVAQDTEESSTEGHQGETTATASTSSTAVIASPPQLLKKRISRTSISDSSSEDASAKAASTSTPVSPKPALSSSQKPPAKLTRQARFEAVTVGGTKIVPADVTFGSFLKPDSGLGDSPLTCTVKIRQKVFVLKARSVDTVDNVINTKLLRALSIPDVEAPDIEVLPPGLCTPLAEKLQADAPNLAQALRSAIPSQLSEKAPGATLESLAENAEKWDLLAHLKPKDMLDPAKVTRDLATRIVKPKKLADAPDSNDSKSWDAAIKTLTQLGDTFKPKFGSKQHQQAIAELTRLKQPRRVRGEAGDYYDFISQIGTDETSARGLLLAKQAGQQTHSQLVLWLKSDAGIGAMAGLAVADLVFGMEDRIIPAWNGANFMFGDGGLWAVDNAKFTSKLYNDPVHGPQKIATTTLTDDSNDKWINEQTNRGIKTSDDVAGSVFDHAYVQSGYYGLGAVDQTKTLAVIKPVVAKTLQALVGLSKSDQFPEQVQKNLKARLQFLGVIQ
jgi:hypothetical protein